MGLQKPFECITCDPGYEWGMRQEFTRPEGSGANGVLCLGESAGFFEARDGLPFRPAAPAGSVLERAFRRLGYNRESFRIANLIQCRPPGDKLDHQPYETAVISHCSVHRDRVVSEMRPRCILALGGLPLKWLTGHAGKFQTIHYMRGYVLDGTMYPGTPIVPTFHPSFLRQGAMHLFHVLCHDIKLAVRTAQEGKPEVHPVEYQKQPSLGDGWAFYNRVKDSPVALLADDIETPTSPDLPEDERDNDPSYEIKQVQFSLAPHTAIVFPWRDPYIEVIRAIYALPNLKANHNRWNFDDPRLRHNGVTIGGPRPHDTMWMWHTLQPDLPAHLQFTSSFYGMEIPWKHLSESDPAWYGACDVDAIQRMYPKLVEDLKRRGVWGDYDRYKYQVQPILEDMGWKRGVPVNPETRQKFESYLEDEEESVLAGIRSRWPEELWNLHPKQGYRRPPKDTIGLIRRSFPSRVDIPDGNSLVTVDATEERWCRLIPPVPSHDQLIRYMKHRNHPVPLHMKRKSDTGDRAETTEKRELMRLSRSTGDETYRMAVEYRELQKARSTYAVGWKGSNGRVHSTFTFSPATGQMSSHNPNVQNAPTIQGREGQVRKAELGRRFREVIEASPGHRLVEFDWKSFHALTLGFEAKDPDYMRAARLDIHSFLTAEWLKLRRAEQMFAMPDDELKDYLAWVKSQHSEVRNGPGKQTVLGYGFGLGYRNLYAYNIEMFSSEGEAKRLLATLNSIFPRTARHRELVKHEAQNEGRLLSLFHAHRIFSDALVPWTRWDIKRMVEKGRRPAYCSICGQGHDNGQQAEQAIAFRPANDAFGMKKEVMLVLDSQGLLERYRLINEVHDALLFECPDDLVDQCIPDVKREMERPSKVLVDPVVATEGLWCEVTVKTGKDWSRMEEVHCES